MRNKISVLGIAVMVLLGALLYGADFESIYKGAREEIFSVQKTTRTTDVAEGVAQGWTSIFLTIKYNPPENFRYVLLPRVEEKDSTKDGYDGSGSQCDKLRIRFNVGNEIVTITQTRCMFSVQVDLPPNEDKSEISLEQVQEVARRLFNNGQDLELLASETKGNTSQGTVKRSDSQSNPSLNGLTWWQDSTSVQFLSIKNSGPYPTPAMFSPALGFNAYWFSKDGTGDRARGSGKVKNEIK